MKKSTLFCTALFALFSVNAQQVQWANKLIKFSSDLGGKQHGIKRILGKLWTDMSGWKWVSKNHKP